MLHVRSGFKLNTFGEDYAVNRTAIGPLKNGKDNNKYMLDILARKVSHTDEFHVSACNVT